MKIKIIQFLEKPIIEFGWSIYFLLFLNNSDIREFITLL
jgi:hypothetical protein